MRWLLAVLLFASAAQAQDAGFDSGGVRIRYVERGSGDPVVLVHGFTATLESSWIATGILPALAREYRVVALDLRGHGASGKPHDPGAYDEIGLDVVRLLDHLGIERAHAVGYSLGGIILAKLLTTHPQRFSRVVIAAAAYRRSRSDASDRAADAAAAEIEAGLYRSLVLSTAPSDEPPPDADAIVRRSAQIARASDLRAHAALMRARRALLVADDEIRRVQVPVLAVVGGADPALVRVRAMQKRWPGLEVRVVPGATHPTVHPRGLLRRPEFLTAVRGWIAK